MYMHNILDRIAYLMDNTELHRTLKKYSLDGIWEAFETINTTSAFPMPITVCLLSVMILSFVKKKERTPCGIHSFN